MQRDVGDHQIIDRGRWWASPTVIALFSIGVILFGIAAVSYFAESMLYQYDQPLHLWMGEIHQAASQGTLLAAEIVNAIPNIGIPLVLIGLTIWWYRHDRYRPAALLFFGTLGQFLVFLAVGFLIGRARPQLTGAMAFIPLPSFPSGHVMTIVTFSTLALFLALPTFHSTWKRWSVVVGVVFFALLIGFLRLFLLAHYLTDVVAGYGLGLICAVVAYVAVSRYFAERHTGRLVKKDALR